VPSRYDELRPAISGIREDALDEGKEATRMPIEDEARPIAILHICRVDDDVQEEAECIDENMPLTALDLLARVKTRRIERRPLFVRPWRSGRR
jgi:hypothetical protein